MRLVSVASEVDAALPDRGDQIVLADDAIAVLHQVNQQVEHLRLDRDRLGAAAQLAPVGIKHMICKEKLHAARSWSRIAVTAVAVDLEIGCETGCDDTRARPLRPAGAAL